MVMRWLWFGLLGFASFAAADPMPPPAPALEVTELLKTGSGTLACTGTVHMPDGKAYALTATSVIRAELDRFWIHETFTGKLAQLGGFKFESFTTYDAHDKLWHRMMMSSIGGYLVGTSPGPISGKSDFELVGADPFGTYRFRDHLDRSAPKTIKKSGERSLDNGKTWTPDYDVICKPAR